MKSISNIKTDLIKPINPTNNEPTELALPTLPTDLEPTDQFDQKVAKIIYNIHHKSRMKNKQKKFDI